MKRSILPLFFLFSGCLATWSCSDDEDPIAVTDLTLDSDAITVYAGETAALTATIAPTKADEQGVTWSTSNNTVATVDNEGAVTGIANGTANITAVSVDGGNIATCAVTVITHVDSLSYGDANMMLPTGISTQIIPTIWPMDAMNQGLTYTTSDASVATVDENGLVTIIGTDGQVIITATSPDGVDGDISASLTIDISTNETFKIGENDHIISGFKVFKYETYYLMYVNFNADAEIRVTIPTEMIDTAFPLTDEQRYSYNWYFFFYDDTYYGFGGGTEVDLAYLDSGIIYAADLGDENFILSFNVTDNDGSVIKGIFSGKATYFSDNSRVIAPEEGRHELIQSR